MPETFPLYVSYSQIAVFQSTLNKPFNDWTDGHVAQGFSWRDGSVSFRIPEKEDCIVEVALGSEDFSIVGTPSRAIKVPFLSINGDTSVASISEERKIRLPEGSYQLTFELIPAVRLKDTEYECAVRFRFQQSENPEFSIVTRDREMTSDGELIKNARPAL